MLGRAAPLGSDKKRQFDYNENPASAGFLLSGDTTGVFARCIASVPLSYRRVQVELIGKKTFYFKNFLVDPPCDN